MGEGGRVGSDIDKHIERTREEIGEREGRERGGRGNQYIDPFSKVSLCRSIISLSLNRNIRVESSTRLPDGRQFF